MRSKVKADWYIFFTIVGVALLIAIKIVVAAVTIVYFNAIPQNGQVFLEWETATEIDIAGFYINRSLTQNSGYARLSSLIPSEGDDLTGAVYQYYDTSVINGVSYWYLLEIVNLDQSTEFYQPPVLAIPSSQTATPTATGTATFTITPTGLGTANRTPTPTRTQTPTSTLLTTNLAITPTKTAFQFYPAPETQGTPLGNQSIITQTTTLTDTEFLTASDDQSFGTATLIPLPEISLVYPTQALDQIDNIDLSTTDTSVKSTASNFRLSTLLATIIPVILILAVWAILGVWYFLTSRQLE